MAGFIKLGQHTTWSTTNWVYFGFLDHVLVKLRSSGDSESYALVEQGKWVQNLDLLDIQMEDASASKPILQALRDVAAEVQRRQLRCSVEGRELDDTSQRQFADEVARLASMLHDHAHLGDGGA